MSDAPAGTLRREVWTFWRTHRGPLWLWLTVTVFMVAGFGYLRLVVYPDRFVPLASVLSLLLCLWHRDLRLLWGMVTAFVAMVLYKVAFLLPAAGGSGNQEWLFGTMQVTNLVVAALAIHGVIRLSERLESTVRQLEQSNGDLECVNEELAAREEELIDQNEELQSQTEELEQQTEELNAQAEEMQSLNEQLVQRERTLAELLDTAAAGRGETETLIKLGETIQRLVGERADGAAILLQADAHMTIQPLFGVSDTRSQIEREHSLAELILVRDRAGSLADLSLRPDLTAPELIGGREVRSLASAPLSVGRSGSGTLEVYSSEAGEWSEHELRIVQWLADQCGRMLTTEGLRAERESLLESERAARLEAERANRAKDEFVAMLSHELRTPLNAVLGWAAVLRKKAGASPQELVGGLEVIERNARQQGQLISDLLDISRVMEGKLHLDVQLVNVSFVVERALESIRQMAEAKGIRLERHLRSRDQEVMGDPVRLQQVIWNLLCNAIKFTPAGGVVTVTVRRHGADLEVSVQDTGEGIEPYMMPHLFERYRQADGSASRRHGGLGLGLAIVKNIVELHGGSVDARSDGLGQGASFLVRLPLHQIAAERQLPGRLGLLDIDAPALTGLEILIVDDDQDARELVSRILTERGAVVHVAASGEAALEALRDVEPDMLISDVGMPGMDGYELIRRVRERMAQNKRPLPAIALTAFARSEDRTRALLAGFQSHVAKPLEPAELIAAVASLRYAVSAAGSEP